MSSSYDPSVDRGALRRRAAEIGRRRLGTQPLSPDLATRRTGLKRSDDQAVAARRRLARCYAALQASPRRPDWDALTRLAHGAEAAAAAARPTETASSRIWRPLLSADHSFFAICATELVLFEICGCSFPVASLAACRKATR